MSGIKLKLTRQVIKQENVTYIQEKKNVLNRSRPQDAQISRQEL